MSKSREKPRTCTLCGCEYRITCGHQKYCSPKCRKNSYKQLVMQQPGWSPACTGVKGAIAELVVAADLMILGCDVFRAVSPACCFDLAAMAGSRLVGVEVRTARTYDDWGVSFSTKSKGADLFAAYLPRDRSCRYRAITETGSKFIEACGLPTC